MRLRDSVGDTIDVSVKASSYVEDGEVFSIAVIRDITEEKKYQAIIQKENHLSRVIIETSPAYFVAINIDGTVRFMNNTMINATGFLLDEIIGVNYMEKFIVKEEKADVRKVFNILCLKNNQSISENKVLCKNGEILIVEWHASSVLDENGNVDYFFGIGIDVGKRKKLQDELSNKLRDTEILSANIKSVFDYSKDMIWAVDSEYRIQVFNKAFYDHIYETYGVKIRVGLAQWSFTGDEGDKIWIDTFERVKRDGPCAFEFEAKENEKYINIYITPVYREDQLISF